MYCKLPLLPHVAYDYDKHSCPLNMHDCNFKPIYSVVASYYCIKLHILLSGHCDGMTHLLCSSSITIPSGQPHPPTQTLGHGEATPMFEQVAGHNGAQSINTCPS